MKIIIRAIVFNVLSEDLGGFRERILPQSVDRTLRKHHDVRALVGHDPTQIIGRVSARTLSLTKDARGLVAEIDPPDSSYAADLIRSIQRRDITGASFSFTTHDENFLYEDSTRIREVLDMTVHEVSAVAFPAYPQSTAEVRSQSMAQVPQKGRSLALALRQQRQAVAEMRSLDKADVEYGWVRNPKGERVYRIGVAKRSKAFVEACVKRYGSVKAIPLTTPRWNRQSGWEDKGSGSTRLLTRVQRQEQAMKELLEDMKRGASKVIEKRGRRLALEGGCSGRWLSPPARVVFQKAASSCLIVSSDITQTKTMAQNLCSIARFGEHKA
jgi:hypothetical protein